MRSNNVSCKDMLLKVSARLIGTPPYELDREIEKSLFLLGEFWGFDCIVLLETLGEEVKAVYQYVLPGINLPSIDKPAEIFSWIPKRIRAGETLCLDSLPHGLPQNEGFFEEAGIKCLLALPVKTEDDTIFGALIALSAKVDKCRSEEEIGEYRSFCEIMAAAFARKKSVEKIDEIILFEQLLSEVSAKYINLPANEVDKAMRNDLGRLGRLLDSDRCILYLVDEDKKIFRPYFHSGWWPEKDNDQVTAHSAAYWDKETDFPVHFQFLYDKWFRGESFQWTQLDKLPEEAQQMIEAHKRLDTKSQLSIPISVSGKTVGVLTVSDTRYYRKWPEEIIPRLRLFGEILENAITRKKSEEALQKAFEEIKALKERLEKDYRYLTEEINLEHNYGGIVGSSDALKNIIIKAKQVASTNATVLILGETGVGKGLIARAVHNMSPRKDRPFVQVNCATLTPTLIESELFGHERGAFTGAQSRRIGRFETADGTTLFLDEIGELPMKLQAKLLRVLQDGEFERVGGSTTIKTDVRIVAATNKDLEKEVKEGTFRRDLWYRLNIFPIHVPPLRERLDDIPLFVSFFVGKYGKWIGKKFDRVPEKMIKALQGYSWPGNIRELENMVERAVITSPDGDFQIEAPFQSTVPVDKRKKHEEFEKEEILKVLKETNWIIEGPKGAARRLGLTPSTFRYRMKSLDIKRQDV